MISYEAPERETIFTTSTTYSPHKKKTNIHNHKTTSKPKYHATSFQVLLENTVHGGSALSPEAPRTAARGDTVTYQEQVSRVSES